MITSLFPEPKVDMVRLHEEDLRCNRTETAQTGSEPRLETLSTERGFKHHQKKKTSRKKQGNEALQKHVLASLVACPLIPFMLLAVTAREWATSLCTEAAPHRSELHRTCHQQNTNTNSTLCVPTNKVNVFQIFMHKNVSTNHFAGQK